MKYYTKQRLISLAFLFVLLSISSLALSTLVLPTVVNGVVPIKTKADRKCKKFTSAMDHVRRFEGGYANCKHDRGGETKYGICKRSYPKVQIAKLTWDKACDIYFQDFWVGNNLHGIKNQQLAVKLMDMCVNMGAGRSAKLTQKAMANLGQKVNCSGFSPEMIEKLNKLEGEKVVAELRKEAKGFYTRLAQKNKSQKVFLKGWLRRASA